MNEPNVSKGTSTARMIVLVSAVVLLINSFLPWATVDLGPFGSVSTNGWHGVGVVAWLFTIVLLVLEIARRTAVLPLAEQRADLAVLATAAAVVLFGLIYVIIRLIDGYLGFGFFIGLIGLIVLAVSAVSLSRSSTAVEELKNLRASMGDGAE